MKNQIAIIGFGYVGKAMHKIFPDAWVYDPLFWDEDKRQVTELGRKAIADYNATIATKDGINQQARLAIICVPTPMKETDEEFLEVDTSIVEDSVKWLQSDLIVIKSTVPPGTTDRLVKETGKKIAFSPEYIGEGKYQITPWKYMSPDDPRTHEFMICGGEDSTVEQVLDIFVRRLGPEKTYLQMKAAEAEAIKYMENSWGAMKVIFAQEWYEFCKAKGLRWHMVREGWALDNRVEKMHTAVFVDERGFGGKCYPKDVNGIVVEGDKLGSEFSLLKAVLRKNKKIRRD
jgi:UDPglucose 6-dehydrogenase